jgi:hypothetical protein
VGTPSKGWVGNPILLVLGVRRCGRRAGQALRVSPMGPKFQWSKPYYALDIFPPGFADRFKTLLQDHWTPEFVLHSVDYFMLVWTCVRDCIKRDAGLRKRPLVRQYFRDVIQMGQWWMRHGGWETKAGTPDITSWQSDLGRRLSSCTTSYPSGAHLNGTRRNCQGQTGYRTMTMTMIEDKQVKPSLQIVVEKEGVDPSLQIAKEREGVKPGHQAQAAQERVNPGLPVTCQKGVAERPECVLVANDEALTEVSLTTG